MPRVTVGKRGNKKTPSAKNRRADGKKIAAKRQKAAKKSTS